jgi:hypothetical protein
MSKTFPSGGGSYPPGVPASGLVWAARSLAAAAAAGVGTEDRRRTPEMDLMDFRIAVHESGHVIVGRAIGAPVAGCTIVPGKNYSGLTWGPNGDPSKYGSTDDVGDLCSRLAPLMPQCGEPRSDVAEMIVHAHGRCVELLAGTEAERVLIPDRPPFDAIHDQREAGAFAGIICCTPAAVDDFLAYARREATALIEAHRSAVQALADALVVKRTLGGVEIDAIIITALARNELATEKQRRTTWARVQESAAAFKAVPVRQKLSLA